MRYSPSENGFYPEDTNYPNLPADVIFIDENFYLSLMAAQDTGKIITANGSEPPYLTEPPPLTREQLITAAELKKKALITTASTELAPFKYADDLGIATAAEASSLLEWKKYLVLLNRVDTSATPDISWPVSPITT